MAMASSGKPKGHTGVGKATAAMTTLLGIASLKKLLRRPSAADRSQSGEVRGRAPIMADTLADSSHASR